VAFARVKVEYEPQEIRGKKLAVHALFWILIIVLLVQLFFPRGAYKFYLLALTPFISIFFDYKDMTLSPNGSFTFKKRHLFPVLMSLAIFLCYRNIYFWILFAWVLFYLWKWGTLSRTWNSIREGFYKPKNRGENEVQSVEEHNIGERPTSKKDMGLVTY
jgi:hypothetical protein